MTMLQALLKALKKFYQAILDGRQKEADRRIAAMQLHQMTDRELRDLNISRFEIDRVVRTGRVAD
jgi:uncharacterized protein YjiS (DUF1127 family)